jgi:peptidoglycan hydrolase-like protein with peptidoglycan-binding domain
MILQRGSTGRTVESVQKQLRDLNLYRGALDGKYGGGTESAVKSFQIANRLPVNGGIDEPTWKLLFPSEVPQPEALTTAPLATRCLALTASFETTSFPPGCFCGIAGDFDGQGLSLGALQWNIGQGTLQPLIQRMLSEHPGVCRELFHDHLPTIEAALAGPLPSQLAFVRALQGRRCEVLEPWRGMLQTLGETPEFQSVQAEAASDLSTRARRLCNDYGLRSTRALALMFDIVVQNGSISSAVRAAIRKDFASRPSDETTRMRIIAERRAAAARPKFQADVLARKMTIANGTGVVHGLSYNLERQFGLTLEPFPVD